MGHCESGEGIGLQGEAATEAHSFRDAEPHPVILANAKINYEIFSKKLREGVKKNPLNL